MAGSEDSWFSRLLQVFDDQPARGPLGLNSSSGRATNNTPGSLGLNDFSSWLANGINSLANIGSSSSQSTTNAVAPTLTPVEFADEYHNVHVSHIDSDSGLVGSTNVDVHIYNNNGLSNHRANMSEKNKLINELKKEVNRANGLGLIGVDLQHKYRIAKAFYGKGFPEDFALVFKYALRYGRVNLIGLGNYCDSTAKLGVDCSGFVNAYFLRTGKITEAKLISSYGRGPLRAETKGSSIILTFYQDEGASIILTFYLHAKWADG